MQGTRLVRSRNDRMIAGVAGGLAAALNIDPLVVRIVLLALAFLNGFGIMLYIALWLLVPNEDSAAADTRAQVRENIGEMQSAAQSMVQRVRGMFNS